LSKYGLKGLYLESAVWGANLNQTVMHSECRPYSMLTPGPLVAPGSGVRGQPYLHILQSVPPPPSSPLSLQRAGKLAGHVHRIPVVVQSLPLMYTTAVRSPSSLNNAIMLPLLEEAKSQGKGETMLLGFTTYL
ncbi:Krueppel-like factor 12, partial [Xenoophorus captivus]